MRALALILCLAVPAYADGVAVSVDGGPLVDVPLATMNPQGDIILTPDSAIALAKEIKRCDAEKAALKDSINPPQWVIIAGAVVVALGAGFAIGAAVWPKVQQSR